MKYVLWLVAGVLVIVLLVLGPGGLSTAVLFGWFSFLLRVMPEMQVHAPTAWLTLIALTLFTLGVHSLGRWWQRHQATLDPTANKTWKFRWSLTLVVVVFLLFTAGIAMVGITHQVGWLASSPEPVVVMTPRPRNRFAFTEHKLWQLGIMGLHQYHNDGTNHLPPGGTFREDGTPLHSWETELLPYLNYVTKPIDKTLPWDHPNNAKNFHSVIDEFLNPEFYSAPYRDARGYGLSHYAANVHVLAGNTKTRLTDLPNGTGNTILVGEVNARFQPWGHPVNWRDPTLGLNTSPNGFGSPPGTNGVRFLMGDCSVRFLRNDTSAEVLRELSLIGTKRVGQAP